MWGDSEMESGFVVRFRTLWHDWLPVALVCSSVVGSIAGGTFWFAHDRDKLEYRLEAIENAQKEMKDNQRDIVYKLDKISVNQQKVLQTLHIPAEPQSFYLYPPQMGKTNGARAKTPEEDMLGKSLGGHSLMAAPQPLYATRQPALDARIPLLTETR